MAPMLCNAVLRDENIGIDWVLLVLKGAFRLSELANELSVYISACSDFVNAQVSAL